MDSLLIKQRREDAMKLLAIDAGAVVDACMKRNDQSFSSSTRAMLTCAVHHAIGEIAESLLFCESFAYPNIDTLGYYLTWSMDHLLIAADMDTVFMGMYGCDLDTARDAEKSARSAIARNYEPILQDLAHDLAETILKATTEDD